MTDPTQLDNQRHTLSQLQATAALITALTPAAATQQTIDQGFTALDTAITTALGNGVSWDQIAYFCREQGMPDITKAAHQAWKARTA